MVYSDANVLKIVLEGVVYSGVVVLGHSGGGGGGLEYGDLEPSGSFNKF